MFGTKGTAWILIFLLAVVGVSLFVLFHWIKNYFEDKAAEKRTVHFKKSNGMLKGNWRTKKGDEYDPDLKLED